MTAPTPAQQTLIDTAAEVLAGQPAVEAVWLAGSLGRGAGDAFSDVDLLALVAEGEAADVSAWWAREGVARVAEPVLVNLLFGGRVVNVVTAEWERFDVVFIGEAQLAMYDANRLAPLFNRTGRAPPPKPDGAYLPSPEAVTALTEEFLRVVGLAPVGLGRGEHLVSLSGVELLRRMALDLMLEENRIPRADRGGALKRNPFLSEAQRAELEALPPLSATRDSLLAANAALLAVFLPRARRLAAEIGATWPAALESATRRHLERVFGPQLRWPEA